MDSALDERAGEEPGQAGRPKHDKQLIAEFLRSLLACVRCEGRAPDVRQQRTRGDRFMMEHDDEERGRQTTEG